MATTTAPATTTASLQELARRHLWMHFTRMGGYDSEHEVPIIVRGAGSYVWDEHGNRYLDGLSALFCVNAGHGRTELGEAAAKQVEELGFYTNWSYAHPRAIELAARIASLAPGDLNRVFFTSGGSEAVESSIKLARSYHEETGNPRKTKFISREIAYHGTSLGALAATGITPLRTPFEPLVPGGFQVPNTNSYRWPPDRDPLWAADQIEEKILYEGPETVAAVFLEPVQNGGGCIPPQDGYFQRVREICDRYDVLLVSDEVICSWGRLGYWFGCERYGYEPDILTTAKGLTSAYAPMGAVIASDRVADPFMHGKSSFVHGFTFGGHPVCAAIAMANIDIFEREDIPGHVREKEGEFRAMLESLRDIPIVGDVRGAGYFHAIELVKDQETKETFDDDESEWLLRGFLSGELYRRGLICRADDRGDPVIQLSPPLICDTEQFEEIEAVLRPVLTEAWEKVQSGGAAAGVARASESGGPLRPATPGRREV
jgi:adenosylmethionine-8-amino-7-oxononanoate aminotransferase